ncbi:hypothetical protein BSL78_06463 [Apostichopus japonicus]|uniref:NACHT domain-containing protein n=1 Tax=Stichopus japonicus TaxID=307972 RepID=A0A2G8L8L9_STIJA|nr:hypothetical protein BSL78_06463 [Apostichopus japonicus]
MCNSLFLYFLYVDTLMERIRQTYIHLGPSWRIDCEYVISYRVTDNTQETYIEESTEDLLSIDESSSVPNVPNDNELVKALHKRDTEKRVLFVGEPGIGKSHLFRSIASKWANGKILKDVILIYLQLDHVPRGACILKEFLKLMKLDDSEQEIYNLILKLHKKKSIVLLDGISNWSRFCNATSNNANQNVNFLTIEELLESDNTYFKKMKVWVTSRNVEAGMKVMKGNYTKVNLIGLNERQRKKFFKQFLKMKKSGKKIRRISTKEQQQYKCKLDEKHYIRTLCKIDETIRSPVVSWYLATRYYSEANTEDLQRRVATRYYSEANTEDLQRRVATRYCSEANTEDLQRREATCYCSEANTEDLQRRVDTYSTDFSDMVETTRAFIRSKTVYLDQLVCLLEVKTTDDNDYEICAQMLQLKDLVYNHIKDEYFQKAMLRLLMTLKEANMVIKSLEIYGACPINLFSCLPEIEQRLVFYNVSFTEIHFIAVIRTLSQQKLTVEFHDSKVPGTFPVTKLLDNCSTTNLSVFRYKGNECLSKLSWEEGVWTKQKAGEDIRHNLQENMPIEQDY